MKEKRLSSLVLTRAWGLPQHGCCMSWGQTCIQSAAGTDGHSGLDFPVAGELYADFGVKEDLDVLAEVLPSQIDAIFLCHGIALKADASNALEVQKVNFLGHKYLLEKILPRIADNGSVNIIASTGGFGWQGVFDDCAAIVNAPSYEAALDWYETHPDVIRNGYVFSKQCLCAYVKMKVHAPEYISRRIRLNAINPGNTLTGLTDDFNRNTSPNGDAAEGKAVIEKIFLSSWNGRWASAEEMGFIRWSPSEVRSSPT